MPSYTSETDDYEACFDDPATSGWPNDALLDEIHARMGEIAEHCDVDEFYLGVVSIVDRRSKHQAAPASLCTKLRAQPTRWTSKKP